MRKGRGSAAVAPKTDVLKNFEKFDHSLFYNNNSIIKRWIWYITYKFYISNGNSFLLHAQTENIIIGNLLRQSLTLDASSNFFDINTKQETCYESL